MTKCKQHLSIIKYGNGYAIEFLPSASSKPVYFIEKYARFNAKLTVLSLIKTRKYAEEQLKRVKEEIDYIEHRDMVGTDEVIELKYIDISNQSDYLGRSLEPEKRLKRKLGSFMEQIEYNTYCIDDVPAYIHNTFMLIFDPSNAKHIEPILIDTGYVKKGEKISSIFIERRGNHYYGLAGWDQISLGIINFLKGNCAEARQKQKIKNDENEREYARTVCESDDE